MARTNYIDNYPTCTATHATIRILHDKILPEEITKLLRIRPSRIQYKIDNKLSNVTAKQNNRIVKLNGWFLESRDKISSLDSRRHIDYLLNRILKNSLQIKELKRKGVYIDIFCFWISKEGHGGPTISPKQSKLLSLLEIDLLFDIY